MKARDANHKPKPNAPDGELSTSYRKSNGNPSKGISKPTDQNNNHPGKEAPQPASPNSGHKGDPDFFKSEAWDG